MDYPFHVQDDELLKCVGRISVNFSALEHIVTMFIVILTAETDSHPIYIVAVQLPFRTKLAVLVSLCTLKIKDPKRLESVIDIITKLSDLETSRNTYIHSFWDLDESKRVLRIKSYSHPQKGFKRGETVVDLKELNAFAERTKSFGLQLMNKWGEYLELLKQGKQP